MMYNRNNFNNQRNSNNNNYNQPAANTYTGNVNKSTDSNNKSFNDNPKLKKVDPLKLKIINEIQRKSKDKSMEELLPEIMKVNQELNRRNMSFTKEETEILLEAIEESLSPEEKSKFNMLKGFMNM